MPQKFISDSVLKQIRTLPNYSTYKILDLSCGEGYIISELAKDGCNVTGTHFKEGDYIIENKKLIENLHIVEGVDLHTNLPFESESFDLILMTEVLEHLETHFTVLREVSRILKKGGLFIFTSPNAYRLHSRFQFLFTGHHKLIQRRLSWDLSPTDLYANHINLINFPLTSTILSQGNIEIEHLFITRFKFKHFYIFPLHPFILLFSILRLKKHKNIARANGEKDIEKWMRSFPMLFSEQLAVVSRKKHNALRAS